MNQSKMNSTQTSRFAPEFKTIPTSPHNSVYLPHSTTISKAKLHSPVLNEGLASDENMKSISHFLK